MVAANDPTYNRLGETLETLNRFELGKGRRSEHGKRLTIALAQCATLSAFHDLPRLRNVAAFMFRRPR